MTQTDLEAIAAAVGPLLREVIARVAALEAAIPAPRDVRAAVEALTIRVGGAEAHGAALAAVEPRLAALEASAALTIHHVEHHPEARQAEARLAGDLLSVDERVTALEGALDARPAPLAPPLIGAALAAVVRRDLVETLPPLPVLIRRLVRDTHGRPDHVVEG